MNAMRSLLTWILLGALAASTLTAFVAPSLVVLYHAPAGETSSLCNCRELGDNISASLVQAQTFALAAGAVLGLVGKFAFRWWRGRRKAAVAPE